MRTLIVNADDFGRSAGVNAGVARCHEDGIVTSATMMVRWPDAKDAADYARGRADLSVGLHLDLGEWVYEDWEWRPLYGVVDHDDEAAVRAEIERQLDRFEALMGRPPTHLDSHQHVHNGPVVGPLLVAAGRRLGVPVRNRCEVHYAGNFYGQDGRGYPMPELITPQALVGLVRDLGPGVTELGCHPATRDDVPGMYRTERQAELTALCDPDVRAAIEEEHVRLASFSSR